MEQTWLSREVPVLRSTVELFEQQGNLARPTVGEIAAHAGLPADEVLASLLSMDEEYVLLQLYMAGGDPTPHVVKKISPEARRVVGQWPSGDQLAEALLRSLAQAADDESNPETKSKLKRVLEDLEDVGKQVMVGVLTNLLTPH